MSLLKGKKGLVFGVANQKSIAWGISKACRDHGAELAFTYLNEQLERRVRPLAESLQSNMVLPCDVSKDEDIESVFSQLKDEWGGIDFVVHSVAYANGDDLRERFCETSREGFQMALDISAFSLIRVAREARKMMNPGGSIVTLSYLGAARVVPHYRVMGVAKAALEATVRELAVDLGPEGFRVNGISAGPVKTLAASGIADFRRLLGAFEERAPIRRLVTIENIGDSAVYLLSDLATAVTGEIHYVDGGFSVTVL